MLIDIETMHFYRWTQCNMYIVLQFNKFFNFYICKKLYDNNVVIVQGKVGF
jgi:hypothetical protein